MVFAYVMVGVGFLQQQAVPVDSDADSVSSSNTIDICEELCARQDAMESLNEASDVQVRCPYKHPSDIHIQSEIINIYQHR